MDDMFDVGTPNVVAASLTCNVGKYMYLYTRVGDMMKLVTWNGWHLSHMRKCPKKYEGAFPHPQVPELIRLMRSMMYMEFFTW